MLSTQIDCGCVEHCSMHVLSHGGPGCGCDGEVPQAQPRGVRELELSPDRALDRGRTKDSLRSGGGRNSQVVALTTFDGRRARPRFCLGPRPGDRRGAFRAGTAVFRSVRMGSVHERQQVRCDGWLDALQAVISTLPGFDDRGRGSRAHGHCVIRCPEPDEVCELLRSTAAGLHRRCSA